MPARGLEAGVRGTVSSLGDDQAIVAFAVAKSPPMLVPLSASVLAIVA